MKRKPRRTKKSAAARVRPFWILIVIVLVAAAAGGYYAAGWQGFRLKRVVVEGAVVVPRAEIISRAAIDGRRNLWLQPMSAAADRIKAIPYVDDVRIRRSLPATVSIFVSERKPFALVGSGGERLIIDRRLRVLQFADRDPALPVLAVRMPPVKPGQVVGDERLRTLARDVETLERAHLAARDLSYDRLGDLLVRLYDGVLVKFGDDSTLQAKASLVEPILSQTQREGKRVRAIDLRAPRTPVVVFR